MKKINIDWLGSCENCGCESSSVQTEEGTEKFLYVGDKITCDSCGHKGEVDADGENAWACWDDILNNSN